MAGTGRKGRYDSYDLDSSGAVPMIDIANTEVHLGLHWTAATTQAGGSAVNVLITAPATLIYHFVAEVDVTGAAALVWSVNPNASGGSAITSFNNNENSSNTSLLTHTLAPTYVSSGTIIETWYVGSATGNAGQPMILGGSSGLGREWTLGLSSVHLLRVEPAASCQTSIRMYYYRGGEV